MPLQNAVPFGNPLPVMQNNVNAVLETARGVATNAGAGINNMSNNAPADYENLKAAFEPITVSGGIPFLPPVGVSQRVPRNTQWSMLVPFFIAMFILGIAILRCPYASTSDSGHLSSLIPLVMIFGEPILSKAFAICAASPRMDSPHFGCGWLSWSFNAILPALSGTRDILPKPEVTSKILNLKSGHSRGNNSFLLSRVLRDLESEYAGGPTVGGLSIEVLEAGAPTPAQSCLASMATNIWTVAIMSTQLVIAIFAFVVDGDESVMLLFATAVFLMEALANMPLWRTLIFSARKDGGKSSVYALMRGNGHRHVFIVRNVHPSAWNLEDLAGEAASTYNYIQTIELIVLVQIFTFFLGITLLTTTLSDRSASYLLTILALGTIGNMKTAAMPRAPWMHGFALKSVKIVSNDTKVMPALKAFEKEYPGLGANLVKEFFPGGLREEEAWWSAREFDEDHRVVPDEKTPGMEDIDIAALVDKPEVNVDA
jgi:hypothetical protein